MKRRSLGGAQSRTYRLPVTARIATRTVGYIPKSRSLSYLGTRLDKYDSSGKFDFAARHR
jgi:hypothetical protein